MQAGSSDTDLESMAVAIVEDFVMRTVQSVKISQVSKPSKVAEFNLMTDFVVSFEATEASHVQAFLARSLAEDLAGLRTLLAAGSCKPTILRNALQRLDETLKNTSVALTPLQVFLRDHAVCKQLLAHGQDRCRTREVCVCLTVYIGVLAVQPTCFRAPVQLGPCCRPGGRLFARSRAGL